MRWPPPPTTSAKNSPPRALVWASDMKKWVMWLRPLLKCGVEPKSGSVKVVRVASAFESGAIVNPENLRSQIEGPNVQGLGGAPFETIEFADGKILNGKMSQYRVPRFTDLPKIEDIPSAGAGECPMIGLAPAVAKAIFDAVGVRLRSLPLVPNGLKVS